MLMLHAVWFIMAGTYLSCATPSVLVLRSFYCYSNNLIFYNFLEFLLNHMACKFSFPRLCFGTPLSILLCYIAYCPAFPPSSPYGLPLWPDTRDSTGKTMLAINKGLQRSVYIYLILLMSMP
ncbi:Thrombospondin type-1 domain-containing protein 1 [Frankliniella fusca]|uniref:Thrombospondin type-1 domain-containing protein 1 n=1 Tax=Frankliniella fusca TaxID=407009 RepID=A0AAE1GZF2_9NEOP|nr:Thrombospondin type-1 domain-containing protein 1 [Frankliniella fusca]